VLLVGPTRVPRIARAVGCAQPRASASPPDIAEKTLVALAKALRVARLEAIVVGNSASMLNGAPVTTQDIDLLIRDTRTVKKKLGASN